MAHCNLLGICHQLEIHHLYGTFNFSTQYICIWTGRLFVYSFRGKACPWNTVTCGSENSFHAKLWQVLRGLKCIYFNPIVYLPIIIIENDNNFLNLLLKFCSFFHLTTQFRVCIFLGWCYIFHSFGRIIQMFPIGLVSYWSLSRKHAKRGKYANSHFHNIESNYSKLLIWGHCVFSQWHYVILY